MRVEVSHSLWAAKDVDDRVRYIKKTGDDHNRIHKEDVSKVEAHMDDEALAVPEKKASFTVAIEGGRSGAPEHRAVHGAAVSGHGSVERAPQLKKRRY